MSSTQFLYLLPLFHNHVSGAPAVTPTYAPGHASINPQRIDQRAFFGLFAILGVAMVLATIWFFFWAKNGGFVWRENDWDDYKTTVLRRKGPDGKTLSNATKSTKLGGRSVVGGRSVWKRGGSEKTGWDEEDALTQAPLDFEYQDEKAGHKKGRKHRHGREVDSDVLAYRSEQPARVGGINRAYDGSHYDYSNASDATPLTQQSKSNKAQEPKRKTFLDKQRDKKSIKRAEKKAKEEIARAKKEREEYANKPRMAAAKPAAPAHSPRRRQSVSTVATSTVLSSNASRSELGADKKYEYAKEKSSYYSAYRPAERGQSSERGNERRQSRERGDGEKTRHRSSSRSRDAGNTHTRHRSSSRQRDGHESRSHSRSNDHSRQSSPRKPRSRFPPSSYNGSDLSSVAGEPPAARLSHPQVPELRSGGYAPAPARRAGGYVNRFKDDLSDSEDEDGDLGGMKGLGSRRW